VEGRGGGVDLSVEVGGVDDERTGVCDLGVRGR